MAILLQTSFEADATGSLPSGWANIQGTWVVSTMDPVTGSNGLIPVGSSGVVTYTGPAPKAYQKITYSQKLVDAPSSTVDNFIGIIARCGSDGGSGYLMFPKSNGAGQFNILGYKVNGVGGYNNAGSSGTILTGVVVGDILVTEVIANGTLIEYRIWKSTGSRPSAASFSITDTSYTTGHIGFYRSIQGSTAQVAIDDLKYEDDAAVTPATAITLTGPTAGYVGRVSASFTVGANGDLASAVTVTPSDSGGGGTFSPTSVSITGGQTAIFTYTAGTTGSKTISVTNNASLANPSNITYSATTYVPGAGEYNITNTNIYFSPGNWYSDGAGSMQSNNIRASSSFAWSNMRGSYLKFKVSGTTNIVLGITTATLASINAAGCPQIAWSVGGAAVQSQLLQTGNTTLTIATGLTAGTAYEVFVWFKGVYITQDGGSDGNYVAPNNRFQITTLTLDGSGTLSAPTIKPYIQYSFGDSITEGDLSNGGPRSAGSQDANLVYPWYLAEALNAEVGIIGFYGQNWSWFSSSWPNYANGFSRLIGGLLSPAPNFITINYGENDGNPGPNQSTVAATLAAVSTAAPAAKMFLIVPFSGNARTNLTAAVLPSNCRLIDLNRYEMLYGNTQWSYDGQHPNAKGHANLGALLAAAIYPSISSGGALIPNSISLVSGRLTRSATGAVIPNGKRLRVS